MASRRARRMALAVVAAAFAASGCTTDADLVPSTSRPAADQTGDETVSSPTSMTAEQICDVLSEQDIAPLTVEKVTDGPEPTHDLGLPGCKWPVQNDYGWLRIGVFEPYDVATILKVTTVREYPVGRGVGHQQFDADGKLRCSALVQTPRTPPGYLVSVKLDGGPDDVNLCEAAVPQTDKVVRALGW
ncbi:DUF3558 family protein [Gordonia soli]|uniref:DUF3558 domain-containing protein n=1 Tax=Gordonia soli NBRC 108243 TaxID=1223545 RepID=M0QHE7_9ACTN|nr:DUF3558 family protein [Gordonia soli]GAC67968.1 hypothetical protein GS4_11_02380 [Gordonia soli NBRC 108243]